MMRAISMPLQEMVRVVMPETPSLLGNYNTRFDFESFFQARGQLLSKRPGKLPQAISLAYPGRFSPLEACDNIQRNVSRFDTLDGFDIPLALQRIAASTPLSHFVVNFGA